MAIGQGARRVRSTSRHNDPNRPPQVRLVGRARGRTAGTARAQIDEPALREGLPLRRREHAEYLSWATRASRLACSAADPVTQVHTDVCYAELTDVVDALLDLHVDVASFEAARSQMILLGVLASSKYQGGVGPGVSDVQPPYVPTADEIASLRRRAVGAAGPGRLRVNPDYGLKTRSYADTARALANMVDAAHSLRSELDPDARRAPTPRCEP